VPTILVNGRLSDRAFDGWQRWPSFAREILAAFDLVLAQSDVDRDRFDALGARNVKAAGNLKYAAEPLAADDTALSQLRRTVAERPRWLAASIHPGEDGIAAAVHRALKPSHPGLLTVVVPRHIERGAEMAAAMAGMGLAVARRSAGDAISADTDVYVADTMGELGLFYRLCDTVFMGKSLAVGGGQNPAEPAQIGCALILGHDMSNFLDMAAELVDAGAAELVHDGGALARRLDTLFRDPIRRVAMARAGRETVAHHAGSLSATLAELAPYLGTPNIRQSTIGSG
jgi:3-deoxy-D-manno-octulosonic-acid transferase